MRDPGRPLSFYLDDVVLTPTELLHHYRELKRLLDMDLAPAVVDRVATVQAALTQSDSRERRDRLQALLDQALKRARAAFTQNLPQRDEASFAQVVDALAAHTPAEDWTGKIAILLAEMDRAGDNARAMGLLDGVLADVIGARGVVAELFGTLPNLGALLLLMMDLINDALPLTGRAPDDSLLRINAHLAAGRLVETRAAFVDYFQRSLHAVTSLAKNEPRGEFESFRTLLERVVARDGIFGGPDTVEAIMLRYVRFLNQGGVAGRREAIKAVTSHLPTALQQVRFLIALAETELGREQMDYTISTLEHLIGSAQRMEDLVGHKGTPRTRMQEIVLIDRFLHETTSLPARICAPLTEKLDALVAGFLADHQVIEKMDDPGDSLRVRAV
ncbi:MAG: hypothetical protein FD149_1718 [Rhodospirillaceae bacterium]|nr:MAG: hypothetical protein FD149_1718 [Rhodospirillaceae bacterium]